MLAFDVAPGPGVGILARSAAGRCLPACLAWSRMGIAHDQPTDQWACPAGIQVERDRPSGIDNLAVHPRAMTPTMSARNRNDRAVAYGCLYPSNPSEHPIAINMVSTVWTC